MTISSLDQAYRQVLARCRSHYENFPVASWALPRHLRRPVAALYAFAREADDLADEGDADAATRRAALDALDRFVQQCETYRGDDAMRLAVADAIERHALPRCCLRDLLSAFRQDVEQSRYQTFNEVMDYCRRSANPVGRLLLALFDADTERNRGHADAVCSALQLINFTQDVQADLLQRNRIYVPLEEMVRFGVTEADLATGAVTPGTQQLMRFQLERALELLREGSPLGRALPGRIGLEMRLIVLAAARVGEAKRKAWRQPFLRPTLNRAAWPGLIAQAVWHGLPMHRDP